MKTSNLFAGFLTFSAAAFALPAVSGPDITVRSENPLEKRYFAGRPTCGLVSGGTTLWPAAQYAYKTLKYQPNSQIVVAGGSCKQVFCGVVGGNNAGISVCNDNGSNIYVNTNYIADAAGSILIDCATGCSTGFKGQWFNTDGWNVVVRQCI